MGADLELVNYAKIGAPVRYRSTMRHFPALWYHITLGGGEYRKIEIYPGIKE